MPSIHYIVKKVEPEDNSGLIVSDENIVVEIVGNRYSHLATDDKIYSKCLDASTFAAIYAHNEGVRVICVKGCLIPFTQEYQKLTGETLNEEVYLLHQDAILF